MIGQRVTILGGFEDGTPATVTAERVSNGRTVYDLTTSDGTELRGYNAARLEPTRLRYRTTTTVGTVTGRPLHTVECMPTDEDAPGYGVWERVASVSALELDDWPDTPYCNGQRAHLDGHPRQRPAQYTGGACDGGAGEWYAGYDDASRGRFYGRAPLTAPAE